jgi:antitoxin component of RelBE/YafQ-DinJ toxin-antitoxin module
MKRMAILIAGSMLFPAYAEDNRLPIEVTVPQQEMVLEEMRDYVAALQEITGGLAVSDFNKVAEAATRMGRGRMVGERMEMARQLPEQFRMMGMSEHDDFDAIARDAIDLQDKDHTLEQVSAALGKCVACHATFRLQLK